jgi:23S rRNA (guanosine2251-2'-O)-methyltransferase
MQELLARARVKRIPIQREPSKQLTVRAQTTKHQGVIAVLNAFPYRTLDSILAGDTRLILVIDGVEDPRNLGAVIRTADACGVGGVLIPSRRNCGITGTVMKTSAGAAGHVPVSRVVNISQTLQILKSKGFWTVGLDMSGEEGLGHVPRQAPLAVVVGGEHRGLRRVVKNQCDFLVRLPMLGTVSSLNLSVAAGVLMYGLVTREESSLP